MNSEQLHELMPDVDEGALSRALEHKNVRSATRDLAEALSQMSRCAAGSQTRTDWEATRDELLAEIRRLTRRINREP